MKAARQGGDVRRTEERLFNPVRDLDIGESTFILGRGHYLTKPYAETLTKAGYPYVDTKGRYGGVDAKHAPTCARYIRLGSGERAAL